MLTAFARLSLEKMYTLTSVKCKRFPSLFHDYETITHGDLAAALVNNERKQRGQTPLELPNPTAERFLKPAEIGAVSVWGSNAERRHCRQEAFAYQTQQGQPSLFVTLTPNSDNTYAMAHYSGSLSVTSLFDSFEADMSTPTQMAGFLAGFLAGLLPCCAVICAFSCACWDKLHLNAGDAHIEVASKSSSESSLKLSKSWRVVLAAWWAMCAGDSFRSAPEDVGAAGSSCSLPPGFTIHCPSCRAAIGLLLRSGGRSQMLSFCGVPFHDGA
jgi:hypothetical protein